LREMLGITTEETEEETGTEETEERAEETEEREGEAPVSLPEEGEERREAEEEESWREFEIPPHGVVFVVQEIGPRESGIGYILRSGERVRYRPAPGTYRGTALNPGMRLTLGREEYTYLGKNERGELVFWRET